MVEDTKASKAAYAAAVREIARVIMAGETELKLNAQKFSALTRIPLNLHDIKDLKSIELDNTQISDLLPLVGLTGLEVLSLNFTKVTDLSPLKALIRLQQLWLDLTNVSDLSPLQSLTKLQNLWLDETNVSDLSPLQALTELQTLTLRQTSVSDLSPLQALTGLQNLWLEETGVSDLSPLQALTGLQNLGLNQNGVSDLSPLQALTGLQNLWLNDTSVSDLRPICKLGELGKGVSHGLLFKDTPATQKDSELLRLSLIEDNAQRCTETLTYLKSLPPWPEPLAWLVPEGVVLDTPPSAPLADPVPRINVGTAGLDLAVSPIDAIDLADPIKKRIYAKLPEAVETLHRFGNRFAEVKGSTDALRVLVAVAFEDADLLDIHLQMAALSDLREADATRPANERFDADCVTALNTVLRLGPPVTLGHPDVDLLEQRSNDYARIRLAATVAEGERLIAAGLAQSADIASDRLKLAAGMVAGAADTGRVAEYRRGFSRNVVIALAAVAESIGAAALGYVPGELTVLAAQFLLAHKDAIMATAPAWGQTGYAWLEYVLIRANQIVRAARDGIAG